MKIISTCGNCSKPTEVVSDGQVNSWEMCQCVDDNMAREVSSLAEDFESGKISGFDFHNKFTEITKPINK